MTYLLEINNLGKRYDDFELSGVSLAVEPGCVVGSSDRTAPARPPPSRRPWGSSPPTRVFMRLSGQPIACGSAALDAIKSRIGIVLDTCAFPDTCRVGDVGAYRAGSHCE